ncbi:response regulator [Thaumasiovibrio subtropicus]|uniref:response regulator n=1 Tax=Thaumasiovibrio subtropicus TaxID=1891207 RepID=UPI000B35328E|nr:response regulator [Thaumasiovibrio subtropicus]
MLNVMIVEDDNEIADLHSQLIHRLCEFRVVGIAGSVQQANVLFDTLVPDLVLLDHYLPDGNGLELLRHWRNQGAAAQVIYLSAANEMAVIREALNLGVFDYLIKPINYHRFQETLSRFADFDKQLLEESSLDQQSLDRLLSRRQKSALKRNKANNHVDPYTMDQVMACFRFVTEEHSAASLSEKTGISKTTARRYLDHAVREGLLTAYLQHGSVGRPIRTYHRLVK